MTHAALSTPFGRRTLSLGQISAQILARDVAPEAIVHKWTLLQDITAAKERLGLPDRALAVLHALLSFHPETTMQAGEPLIVFPSNDKLIARCHGIAPATLRRHLAILVETGLIIRRDSPNGKRYARRGGEEGGAILEAFGFDLAPLVARAQDFAVLALACREERRLLRALKARLTLARRDSVKLIEWGLDQGLEGPWADWQSMLLAHAGPIKASLTALQGQVEVLEALAAEISNHLETWMKSAKISAKESHFEPLIHNSKHNPTDSELAPKGDQGKIPSLTKEADEQAEADRTHKPSPVHLGMVLEACPDLIDYAPVQPGEGPRIRDWADFVKTAGLVRAMLGISPDAWRDAVATMGEIDACICVAAILQKGDEIRFPGGYLRALSEKKRGNAFSTGPILMALIGAKLKARRIALAKETAHAREGTE